MRTPGGHAAAYADGGHVPANHDGQMWDLTIPGNNDHDFYVLPAESPGGYTHQVEAAGKPILVHNDDSCGPDDNSIPSWVKSAKIWELGRPDFPGRAPVDTDAQDPITSDILLDSGADLADGHYQYVVMPDGSFVAAVSDDMYAQAEGPGHTSLSERGSVIMAGTFRVENGDITMFDNNSGHYMANTAESIGYTPLETVAREAFKLFGLPAPLDDAWDPVPWAP